MAIVSNDNSYFKINLDKSTRDYAVFTVYDSKEIRDFEKNTNIEWINFSSQEYEATKIIYLTEDKLEKPKEDLYQDEEFMSKVEYSNKLRDAFWKSRLARYRKDVSLTDEEVSMLEPFGYKKEWQSIHMETGEITLKMDEEISIASWDTLTKEDKAALLYEKIKSRFFEATDY